MLREHDERAKLIAENTLDALGDIQRPSCSNESSLACDTRSAVLITSSRKCEEFMSAAWAEFERYEQEVKQEGERKGLTAAVLDLCEVFGIALSDEQRDRLQRMDIPALTSLRTHLKLYRAWPNA